MKNIINGVSVLAVLALTIGFGLSSPSFALAAGPAAVNLGSASNFVILTKTGVTNVPTSSITGNIGTSLDEADTNTSLAGLTCGEVTGIIYSFNSTGPLPCVTIDATLVGTAVADMETAYTNASAPATPAGVGATNLNVGAGTLTGLDFVPGTYTWNTPVNVTGDITLTGSETDTWIFQISGTLTLAANRNITLVGGAQASNIFWQVADTVTLEAGSSFQGNIIAQTNVVMITGATITGRMLAQTAVTLQSNSVTVPVLVVTPVAPVVPVVVVAEPTPTSTSLARRTANMAANNQSSGSIGEVLGVYTGPMVYTSTQPGTAEIRAKLAVLIAELSSRLQAQVEAQRQSQIAIVKAKLISLMTQLIPKLEAQLAVALAAQR